MSVFNFFKYFLFVTLLSFPIQFSVRMESRNAGLYARINPNLLTLMSSWLQILQHKIKSWYIIIKEKDIKTLILKPNTTVKHTNYLHKIYIHFVEWFNFFYQFLANLSNKQLATHLCHIFTHQYTHELAVNIPFDEEFNSTIWIKTNNITFIKYVILKNMLTYKYNNLEY